MLQASGRAVSYSERPYDFQGRSGVTRTLTIAGTGGTLELRLPEEVFLNLKQSDRALLMDEDRLFGTHIWATVEAGAFGRENGNAQLSLRITGLLVGVKGPKFSPADADGAAWSPDHANGVSVGKVS